MILFVDKYLLLGFIWCAILDLFDPVLPAPVSFLMYTIL
jgi:hypothetical protein